MNEAAVLVLSLVIQSAAAVVALALVRLTGRRLAWLLIAAGLGLMAVRRGIVLYHHVTDAEAHPLDDPAEWVALANSTLMLAGVVLILPFFRGTRRVETERQESRRMLSTLMSNLPGLAYRCRNDRHWTMEFVSDGCVELTGHQPDELVSNRSLAYADLIHPDDREMVWTEVQAGVAQRRPFRLTYRIRTAGGAEKWVWEQGRGVFDAAGRVEALEGLITDISERRRAEERLRFFQFAVDHAGDAVFWIYLDARFFYVNDAACRSLGFSREELETLCVHDIDPDFPPDRWPDTWQSIRRSTGGEGSLTFESRHRRKDGSIFPVEITASLLEMDGQEFVCAFARDTTERKRAQRALQKAHDELERRVAERTRDLTEANRRLEQEIVKHRQTEAELRESSRALARLANEQETLLKHTRDFLYRHDADGVFDYLSPAVEQVTGYSVDRWKKHYTAYLTDNPLNEKVVTYTETALRTGMEQPPYLVEVLHRDGHPIVLEVAERPYFEQGRVAGIIGVARDVTERVRAQEALQKAKEAAEAANRTKTVFLANVSHEIRTPITAMLGAAEHLSAAERADPALREPAEIILRNGRHLLILIEDLLDLARAEAGRLEIRRDDCSLPDLLRDVAALTQPLLRRPNVDFRIVGDTPLPVRIHTDATRLKQAIINLINNSLKFTTAGSVRVRVGADRDRPDPRLIVAVEDTGVGVPADAVDRIFEPFTQIDPGSCDVSGGVGLGLPLARWIAEQLGGRLSLTKTGRDGSVFTLEVPTGPLDNVECVSPDAIGLTTEPWTPQQPLGSAVQIEGTVLLAEDFHDTRVMIQHALQEYGATVTTVDNGHAALEVAARQSFDLIIMDIRMPGLNGIEATAELRRRGYLGPIVALTASTTKSDRERLLEAGFDDLWIKPIGLGQIVSHATPYLGTRSSPAPQEGKREGADEQKTAARLTAVAREFAQSLPRRAAGIRDAVERGELSVAEEELHKLVGAAGIHGLTAFSQEAARLLAMCREGVLRDRPGALDKLLQLASEDENYLFDIRKSNFIS